MTKGEYNNIKEFFLKYVGLIYMRDGNMFGYHYYDEDNDTIDYGDYIDDFIDILRREEFVRQKELVEEMKICLELEYKTPVLETIITSTYNGQHGDDFFNEEMYIMFETMFKHISSRHTFDETILRMKLLEFTHVGALYKHLHDYIHFKNLSYHPDMEQRTKYKVQFIKRVREDKRTLVMDYVKIDRRKKKINDRNNLQSITLGL